MLMPVLHFNIIMASFRFHENITNFSMIINMLLIFLFVYNLSTVIRKGGEANNNMHDALSMAL